MVSLVLGSISISFFIPPLYRVQYIQDVILPAPSLFEENKYAALNSFLLFNKSEIVTVIRVCLVMHLVLYDRLFD